MNCARDAYAEMRSLARRRASHSSSAGGSPYRKGASVAPGSMRTAVAPTSTYVAIERTTKDSAASGMTVIRLHQDRGAPRLCRGAAEHTGAWGPFEAPM